MITEETPILAQQNQDPASIHPEVSQDSIDALDALIAANPSDDSTDPGVTGAIDSTPDVPASLVTPVEPVAPVAPVAPVVTPEVVTPEVVPVVEDEFDKLKVHGLVKPATAAAFDNVKKVARERIAAQALVTTTITEERDRLAKELADLKSTTRTITPEIESELTELRSVVSKHDVKYSQPYRDVQKTRDTAELELYALLKTAGLSDAHIAQARELGAANVDWDQVTGLTKPTLRAIDAKIGAIEQADQQVQRLTEEAAKAPAAFVSPKDPRFWDDQTKRVTELSAQWMPTMAPRAIPAGPSDAPEVQEAVRYNNDIKRVQDAVLEAQRDNSPEMKAALVGSIAQLADLQNTHKMTLLASERVAKEHTAEISKLNQEIATRQTELDRIKNASTVRLQSGAPAPGSKPGISLSLSSEEALDALIGQG